ncbi:MAG: ferredoxin-NADP reductase [Candidatus Omnitrophica bacterium CG11_big_fil_rev_8_21_14_0_20_42_13]|uniref:Ferredoxin-NADP reductase n=1 Tax=Candidatus Ghiorseimicrobium undicola TaxID=1974746 RepID=A0A2H0LWL3_9BACT|nr:MAG: ferredoxin-NADP reductase [Candidatus Omnitrophica bacterium CG11_big_fil_rev_8_21_14_0_20_42_13]
MYKIVHREILNPSVKKITIEAPDIAAKAKPGQFVVIMIDEKGERIPLTISETGKGTISLVFQEVGFTTRKLGKLNSGDSLLDILGPLGHAAEIINYGTVVCVAGGVGAAEVLPVAKALKDAQNTVIGILGARTKNLLILEDQLRANCHKLYIATDDGSYGQKGLVTDILKGILDSKPGESESKRPIGLIYAIGPVPMMAAVSDLSRPYNIKTKVCLNPIMVDGTGMCGSCRVTVDKKIKFCCVDGPDFDGHQVDFKELSQRLAAFKSQEQKTAKL